MLRVRLLGLVRAPFRSVSFVPSAMLALGLVSVFGCQGRAGPAEARAESAPVGAGSGVPKKKGPATLSASPPRGSATAPTPSRAARVASAQPSAPARHEAPPPTTHGRAPLARTREADPPGVASSPLASAAAPSAPAPVVQGPSVQTPDYAAHLQTSGRYAVGEAGAVVAVVAAHGDYKCNAQYPARFTVKETSGVTVSPAVVRGSLAGKTGALTIPLRATRQGPSSVSGELKFSVCSQERCLLEKQDLRLDFEVE